MFNKKLQYLIDHYGVKQQKIIDHIRSNRIDFASKMKDNTFTEEEKRRMKSKYGDWIK